LFELQAPIAGIEPLHRNGWHGGWSIACRETIFRPAGGGQPEDHGFVEIDGVEYEVNGLHKDKGLTYLQIPDLKASPRENALVVQRLAGCRRDRLSRLHTLQHIFSAEVVRVIPEAMPCGTGIRNDASGGWVRIRFPEGIGERKLTDLDCAVRSSVLAEAPVSIARAGSVESAAACYGSIFRLDPSVKLIGKVRVVVIQEIDANCCSGTHWESSGVGPYAMTIVRPKNYPELIELQFVLTDAWMYFYGDRFA